MAAETSTLYPLLLRAFLAMGKARVLPQIPSTQLRAGLQDIIFSETSATLWVPHYWAIFAHDGRGLSPREPGVLLIWFKNPSDDPRLDGGKYPVFREEVRHLSKGEFQFWLDKNRKAIAAYKARTGVKSMTSDDYIAADLPMIVAKRSPRKPGGHMKNNKFDYDKGVPFFSNGPGGGMQGFIDDVNAEGRRIVNAYIKERLTREGILNKKIVHTIQI